MKISSKECKAQARKALIGNYPQAVGLCFLQSAIMMICMVILIIVTVALTFYQQGVGGTMLQNDLLPLIIVRIFSYLITLLQMMLMPGLVFICLKFAKGETGSVSDLMFAFRHATSKFFLISLICLALNILFTLPTDLLYFFSNNQTISIVLLFIQGIMGLLSFVVMIYLSLNYGWVYWILTEDPTKSILTALNESKLMMKGCRGSYIYLGLSFIGWYIIGMYTMGLAYLWIYPYAVCTFACFYLNRKKQLQIDKIIE